MHRLAEFDDPAARQRHHPERAEPREGRRHREVRQAQQPREWGDVAEHGIGLLGTHDGGGDDGYAGPQRGRDEAPAPEALQLVALTEGLPDPLEALGPNTHEFAAREESFRIGHAGERVPGLACERGEEGRLEDQVGTQHAQVALSRVVVIERDLRHQRIECDGARVVGDDERAARRGDPVDTAHLHAEPPLEEGSQRRDEHVVGQVGIEAEVVDRVVTGEPTAQEVEESRALVDVGARCSVTLGVERDDPGVRHARPPETRAGWRHRRGCR